MTKTLLRIAIAQQNYLLGDIKGNAKKIIDAALHARDVLNADLIVFPELALTGYPPEDLLLRADFQHAVDQALQQISQALKGIHVVVGHSEQIAGHRYNAASVFFNQQRIAVYHKQHLPNYSVFDEKRYFTPGHTPCVFTLKQTSLAIVICEDLWHPGPMTQAANAGAQLVLSLNASPFYFRKHHERLQILQTRQQTEAALPIIYVSCVGGQDELVFDGGSMAVNAEGELCHRSIAYQESIDIVTVDCHATTTIQPGIIAPDLSDEASIYSALVLGTRDYIEKNHFNGALVGLSGGIDSALTLAIAADAIGTERVHAVLMPSRYTAAMSVEDALSQVQQQNIKHSILPIESIFSAFLDTLTDEFAHLSADVTEENLQARCRGTLLMALSNKFGKILLTTGNKSEMAVGYATLYGDMAGGFAVLKDVLKTWVYRLARYRNSISPIIPQRVLERAPSAELAENQTDQDSLPNYDILDQIITHYVEQDQSVTAIIDQGFPAEIVKKTIRLIDRNEYKRRQAAPGIKITPRAFGRDWRYPITSGFKLME